VTGCEGQDWASYQDWTPGTAGLGFVFIKATEGTGYVNPRYASQLAAVRAGTAVPGHYHFARPGPSMQAQADYFLRHITLKPGDMLALDWEDSGVTGGEKDTFLKYLKAQAPAHRVVLYCNRDFWINRDTTSYAADGLWIADPDAPKGQPRIKTPWLFHQYSDAGGMDRDYCNLSADALRAWAQHQEAPDMPLSPSDLTAIAKAVASYSHNDDPDVHQTWQTAAVQATAAAAGVKSLAARVAAPTLTDAQVQAIVVHLATNPAFIQALAAAIGKDLAARMQS
jgi:hypothetical protein